MSHSLIMAALLLGGSAFVADAATPDRDFYMKAAATSLAEVETGKLAQAKGTTPAVREVGAMVARDHTRAKEKLKEIAARKNITLPAAPDAKHKATKRELEAASGPTFDSAYLYRQIADHEATKTLLRQQIATGRDADAKAWARETLPTVMAHLRHIRALSSNGVDSIGAGQRRW